MDQVLYHFRDRFITEVDVNAIAYKLKDKKIISHGELMFLNRKPNATEQNKWLHAYLGECTKDALAKVCQVIIAVEDKPKMRAVGVDMKNMLECKCCVCSYVYICVYA